MKKFLFFNFLSSILATVSFALVAGPSTINGTIKSFDAKIVVIENDKVRFEVPRGFVNEKEVKANNKVEVLLSQEQADQVKILKKKDK